MFTEVFGLPTHTLIVHVVVVLLPLAALGAIVLAVLPRLIRTYGLLVGVLTLIAVVAVPVATRSGESLYDRKSATFTSAADAPEAVAMDRHRELGEQLLPYAGALLVAVLLLLGGHLLGRRVGVPTAGGDSGVPAFGVRLARGVVAVLTVVAAVMTVVMLIRAGHAGSDAVWGRLPLNE